MRTAFALLVLVPFAVGAAGQRVARYGLGAESRFWIDGTSTAGAFTCTAARVAGVGQVAAEGAAAIGGRVTVPVRAFDCGNRRMNVDMGRALKGDAHPAVRFEVQSAALAGPGASGWTRARATGSLDLAAVVRPLVVDVEGRSLPDGRVRLRGRMPMRMTDFGVDPPTGLLGLVRAHDRILVRFDLVAVPD